MPQYQGVWSLQQQMQALTSGQWATDPLFDYTTLLLQADNAANGAQNNTFLDSSTNAFAITRNGNTTQGTFSPFSLQPGAWGNYFNGSTDYITTSNANFAMGTSNFTVECWVYLTAYPTGTNTDGYIATWLNNSGNGFWLGTDGSSGKLAGYVGQGASADGISAGVVPLNTWVHTAFTRNGSTLTIWMNGVAIGSTTTSRSLDRTPLAIGSTYSSSIFTFKTTGYISNARVVSGQCLYTGTFTPSTTPFTSTSVGSMGPGAASSLTGTVTLLTSQSNRFVDNSASANTLTISGTPSVQAFSPFAPQFQYTASGTGGSAYFDGTGDYLSVGSAANWAFMSNATALWSIEGWFYNTSTGSQIHLFDTAGGTTNNPGMWVLKTSSETIRVSITRAIAGSYVVDFTTTGKLIANSWNHVVITYDQSLSTQNVKVYLNGAAAETGNKTANPPSANNPGNALSMATFGAGGGEFWVGYFGSVRISNIARSAPSGVPTSPYTRDANTVLLTNFTNAGILDGTMKNNLETVGNAQVSTSVVKYGSGSLSFDGTGDYLYKPNEAVNQLGTGDYTIEFWVYGNSWSSLPVLLEYGRPSSAATAGLQLYVATTSGRLDIYGGTGTGTLLISAGSNIPTTTWTHVALTRASGSTKLFINGTQTGSTATDNTNYSQATIWIGAIVAGSTNNFNGYLDDFRITKGIARYTQNFIPPSVALPRQ